MKRKTLSLFLVLVLFLSLLSGISFIHKTSKVVADEVEGIELSVLKVWDDYNDMDELRPSSVEVTLYQNNQKTNIKVTLSASNNWYYKYDTLVAEKDNNGDKINYTWRCDDIDGYERFEDNLDNMYIITDVHHAQEPSVNSVVLQKFNEKDEFFDDCNMILKNQSGDTLITWTTGDNSSINTYNSGLSATMNSDGSLVINNIPEGEYVYEEVKPKTGYTNTGRKEFKIEKGTHNYTFNWYTDIQDAVTDANNLNNNNADCYRDDKDCEAGLFIINNKSMLILLKDKDNCETISLANDTIFDLENNDLKFKTNNQIEFKEDLRLLEGNIIANTVNAIDSASSSNFTSDGSLEVEDINIINESNNSLSRGINGNQLSFLNVYNSKIKNITSSNSTDINSSGCFGLGTNNNYCEINLVDSEILSKTTDNSYLGLCCSLAATGNIVNIDNCNFELESTGYQCLGVRFSNTTSYTDINIKNSSIDVNKKAHSTNRNTSNASVLVLGVFNSLNVLNSNLTINSNSMFNNDRAHGICLATSTNNANINIKNNSISSTANYCSYGISYQATQKNSNSIIDNNTIISNGFFNSYGIDDFDTSETKNLTIKNNIMTCSSDNKIFGVILSNCNCDMLDNNIRCELPTGVVDKVAYGILVYKNSYLHYMSGNLYSDISKDSTSLYNPDGTHDRFSSTGHALEAQPFSKVLIDESEGSTSITGGDAALYAFENSEIIVNGGIFKSPNHGSLFACGSNGHCEINGGTFKNNKDEYSTEKLNEIWDYSSLYLCSKTPERYDVDVKNATIIGGSSGLNIKGDTFYGCFCHVYNSFIKGRNQDILLSSDTAGSKISNSFCYIENGTTFEHEGTENMWYDAPFIYGLGQHIFDHRTQETTTGGGE